MERLAADSISCNLVLDQDALSHMDTTSTMLKLSACFGRGIVITLLYYSLNPISCLLTFGMAEGYASFFCMGRPCYFSSYDVMISFQQVYSWTAA